MSDETTTMVVHAPGGALVPTLESAQAFEVRLAQFQKLADGVVKARMVPKGMDPGAVMVAMQTGFELGLAPMQSLKSVTVINGRSGLMGEAALGLLRARNVLKPGTDLEVRYEGEKDSRTCIASLHRVGHELPFEGSFSIEQARTAKLWAKTGPWTEYPQRMLMWRALGFLLRDHFSDVTMGLGLAEEIRDIPTAVAGAGTDFDADPPDASEDPLLKAAMGDGNPVDFEPVPEAGAPAPGYPEPDEAEDVEPIEPEAPKTAEAQTLTCPCGATDLYPIGQMTACFADCGRQTFVNMAGTGFSTGWIEGREPTPEAALEEDQGRIPPLPEKPEVAEPDLDNRQCLKAEFCTMGDGHDGPCFNEGSAKPPEPDAPKKAPRELKCKCGHTTIVQPGTASPVSCASDSCDRRFRKIQRGQSKGMIQNEKDPSWVKPGAESDAML